MRTHTDSGGSAVTPGRVSERFESQLDKGGFITTAEFRPPTTASADYLLEKAGPIASRVDAVNITDGASARVHTSSLAAAALLVAEGYEPILQVTCRDRNRIALEAHFLGAAALGINNVLCMRGDDPTAGDHPDAKGVFDLDTLGLIKMAATLRDDGVLLSGRTVERPPQYLIGAVDTPVAPTEGWSPDPLIAKIDAGARFVQTQYCFDPAIVEAYVGALTDAGITEKVAVLIGLGPISSAKSARWMRENLYGVDVPDSIVKRLDDAADPKAEGRRICIELMGQFRDIPGVAGVHLMAVRGEAEVIAVLEEAGLR